MTTRKYSSRSQQTTLSAGITDTATSATVISGSALLGGATVPAGTTFTVVIDPDTALEEIVDVTAVNTNVLTIVRGIENAGTGQAHSAGAAVRHMAIGRDFREANLHIEATGAYNDGTGTHAMHGIASGEGDIVGTAKTQPLTNKTISGSANTITNIGTSSLVDSSVTTAKIADSAVTSAKIADLTIATGDIADSAITSGKIATGAVGTTKIDDLSVTTGKIVDGAITSAKIADGTIVAGDIADGAVTSAKILDGTIVNADVNSSAQIAYGKLNLTNSIANGDISATAAIALSKLAVDPLARANHTGTQTASTISDFDTQVRTSKVTDLAAPTGSFSMNSQKITNVLDPTSAQDAATKAYADTKIAATEKGAVNGVATLGSDGKLTAGQIPDVTITNTFVVSSQAAMLALTAQTGDVAVRTDLNKSFILTASPATTLGNWQELLTPTDSVLSVDGMTGAVSLSSTYATVANAANKLPLAGGTMSGAIAMGTNKITGLGDPTNAQDAATKNYIDTTVLAPSNLTGPITSVGNATSIASQTGTGTKFVVDDSPTIVTPTLSGNTTAGTINNTTIPSSKTLVATDSTQYVVPSQTGNAGKVLSTDGSVSSWSTTINPTTVASNVGVGTGVLAANTTGANNTAVGNNALNVNTIGLRNVAVGAFALDANTTGNDNTAVGNNALGANTTGISNTAIGGNTLQFNTIGTHNVAVGNQALNLNTTGFDNTAVGAGALDANTIGTSNTALGKDALGANTTGSNNAAMGAAALQTNTTGSNNTAVGVSALQTNTTGDSNTAVGVSALLSNTIGTNNTALGAGSLQTNTTGINNTAVGRFALSSTTIGTNNTAMGRNALLTNTTGVDNTAVGAFALDANTTGFNNVAMGSNSLGANTIGTRNTAIGVSALLLNTTGADNVAVGHGALSANTIGANNTTVGASALQSNTTGNNNTAIGVNALNSNTIGVDNTAIGRSALTANTTGNDNIAIGREAGNNNTTGVNNIFIGNFATGVTATTSNNITLGNSSMTTLRVPGIGLEVNSAGLVGGATVTNAATGIGYMGVPPSAAATTGSYTIVAGDAGEHIYSTATRTITIPANGSVAFPVGTAITFIAATGATVTIAITTDTLLLAGAGTTGSRTLAPFGMATAIKITSTSWIISGNGLS